MKAKLRSRLLRHSYLQGNYSLLHPLTQGAMSVEEYTIAFEKQMIKCDLQESEN